MKENYIDYKKMLIDILRLLNSYFIFPKKLILIHTNKFTKYKIVNTSEIEAVSKKFQSKNTGNTMEEELINSFVFDLKKTIPEEYLNIGIENIKQINCYSSEFINFFFALLCYGGVYISRINSICISTKGNKEVLYHELLHAMSAFKCNDLFIIGFRHKNIGHAINEGYTDLLAKRLLNIKKFSYNIGYPYEAIVSNIIELIIGQNTMYSLYFNGDLSGLINTLSKYQPKDNVMDFITNLDKINKITYLRLVSSVKDFNENIYLNNLYNKVNIFLYDLLSNKFDKCYTIDDINSYLCESKKIIDLINLLDKYTTFEREKQIFNHKTEVK